MTDPLFPWERRAAALEVPRGNPDPATIVFYDAEGEFYGIATLDDEGRIRYSNDRESDRLREMLPPIPGRRWMVGKVAGGAMTVLTALAPREEPPVETMPLLPCVIVYRNVFGRRSSLSAGLFAATVLALIPEACNALLAMAAHNGIPVRVLRDEASEKRAARSHHVRRIATQVATRVRMT